LLNINLEFHRGILFIRLNGCLDETTVKKLENEVTCLIKESGIRNIVFNMTDLNSIDLSGIDSLITNYQICKSNNGNSLICGLNDFIKQKVCNSKLLNYMYEIKDELSALNYINL